MALVQKNSRTQKFFKFLEKSFAPAQIVRRPFAGLDSSGFSHRCEGVIYAESEEQVLEVVVAANRFAVPIYPISTGLNVGYGDGLPARPGQVILDLRRMNRILEFNEEEGWIRIQPGASQEAVAEFLKERAPHLGFDLTYWLKEASVIGNALERGRTLFAEREADLIGAKLILGSGAPMRTGFDPSSPSPLSHGLNLHPLIFQSNLGVVVEGIVRLRPRNPRARYFLAGFRNFEGLTKTVTRMNRGEIPGAKPLRWFCADSFARSPVGAELKKKLAGRAGGALVLESDRAVGSAELREALSAHVLPVPRQVFMTTPSLQSVRDETPLSFFSFTVRRSAPEIAHARRVVERMRTSVSLSILHTISFLGESCQFLLLVKGGSTRGLASTRAQIRKISETLRREGYRTYRNHSALPARDLPNAELKKMIKHCFDPKGVISPGRYGLQ